METARLLHAFGGHILSFMGAIPAMRHLPLRTVIARPGTKTVDFSGRHKAVDTYRPAPDEILSGDPLQTATYVFVSPDKMFAAGIWACQPGKFRNLGRDRAGQEALHALWACALSARLRDFRERSGSVLR